MAGGEKMRLELFDLREGDAFLYHRLHVNTSHSIDELHQIKPGSRINWYKGLFLPVLFFFRKLKPKSNQK